MIDKEVSFKPEQKRSKKEKLLAKFTTAAENLRGGIKTKSEKLANKLVTLPKEQALSLLEKIKEKILDPAKKGSKLISEKITEIEENIKYSAEIKKEDLQFIVEQLVELNTPEEKKRLRKEILNALETVYQKSIIGPKLWEDLSRLLEKKSNSKSELQAAIDREEEYKKRHLRLRKEKDKRTTSPYIPLVTELFLGINETILLIEKINIRILKESARTSYRTSENLTKLAYKIRSINS